VAPYPQALILSPVADLALQTRKVVSTLGYYMGAEGSGGALVHSLVGKTSVREDLAILKAGVHIVSGTPGRVFHMVTQGALQLGGLKLLVVDEADLMLDEGFKEQLFHIFQELPPGVQIALFSATMTADTLELSDKFIRADHARILIPQEELSLKCIAQYHTTVTSDSDRLSCLLDLFKALSVAQSIVFVNTRRRVELLAEEMKAAGHCVTTIHGEMDMPQRKAVLDAFKAGSSRVLIASGLLSRGFDCAQVSLVVNFDVPNDRETYIHRVGRSGRAGRKGNAVTFMGPRDVPLIKDIEENYTVVIKELPLDIASISLDKVK